MHGRVITVGAAAEHVRGSVVIVPTACVGGPRSGDEKAFFQTRTWANLYIERDLLDTKSVPLYDPGTAHICFPPSSGVPVAHLFCKVRSGDPSNQIEESPAFDHFRQKFRGAVDSDSWRQCWLKHALAKSNAGKANDHAAAQ